VSDHCVEFNLGILISLGGMPSPTRQSRLEIVPSGCLIPVTSNEGRAFIPPIPAGQTVTLRGSIKAMIREPENRITDESSFKEVISVALQATMPGLNRKLDHFNVQKTVEIQYPLELRGIDFLRSVAQGSENKIKMKVTYSNMNGNLLYLTICRSTIKVSNHLEVARSLQGTRKFGYQFPPKLARYTPHLEIGQIK